MSADAMGARKRILIVDDEPNILNGLRRMLHPLRGEWATAFASSGDEALAILAAEPYDVLVTDMRMPGMDGAELLGKVRARFPGVARIVLSGHSDREMVLRSVCAAHQYLAKPCDPALLREKVATALALRDLLASPALTSLASRIAAVPSLPDLYLRITAAIEADGSSEDIAGIVARDPAMSAKVLQLVNSSFFGRTRRASTPRDAVVFLGFDTIRSLVLGAHVFAKADAALVAEFGLEALWDHSWRVSLLARTIATDLGAEPAVQVEAAMAGLLHAIGRVVLATQLPDEYRAVVGFARSHGVPLAAAAAAVLSASDAALGAYLLGLWGLPGPIVAAVAWYPRPSDSSAPSIALTAVHVANALLAASVTRAELGDALDTAYLDRCGAAPLERWREGARRVA